MVADPLTVRNIVEPNVLDTVTMDQGIGEGGGGVVGWGRDSVNAPAA